MTVVMIHNSMVLVEPIKEICKRVMPDVAIINIIDESLVRDIIKYGGVKPEMIRRITRYALSAQDLGADAVVMTCSSLGETVALYTPMLNIKSFRIDEPMALHAVRNYDKIGLIGTLPSVIGPSTRLLEEQAAKIGKTVAVESTVCSQAFIELMNGNRDLHDALLKDAVCELARNNEVIVMAQGSMAKIAPEIEKMIGKPVLTCMEIGIRSIAEQLKQI